MSSAPSSSNTESNWTISCHSILISIWNLAILSFMLTLYLLSSYCPHSLVHLFRLVLSSYWNSHHVTLTHFLRYLCWSVSHWGALFPTLPFNPNVSPYCLLLSNPSSWIPDTSAAPPTNISLKLWFMKNGGWLSKEMCLMYMNSSQHTNHSMLVEATNGRNILISTLSCTPFIIHFTVSFLPILYIKQTLAYLFT